MVWKASKQMAEKALGIWITAGFTLKKKRYK